VGSGKTVVAYLLARGIFGEGGGGTGAVLGEGEAKRSDKPTT